MVAAAALLSSAALTAGRAITPTASKSTNKEDFRIFGISEFSDFVEDKRFYNRRGLRHKIPSAILFSCERLRPCQDFESPSFNISTPSRSFTVSPTVR